MNLHEGSPEQNQANRPQESVPEAAQLTPETAGIIDLFKEAKRMLAEGKRGEADLYLNLDYPKLLALEEEGKLTSEQAKRLHEEADALYQELEAA